MKKPILLVIAAAAVLTSAYFGYRWFTQQGGRTVKVLEWLRNPNAHQEWTTRAGERCGQAPFLMPTDGFIGYLWGDSFRAGHSHQGVDIFGGGELNQTPVLSVYPGYLTRKPDWKASVIIRVPEDPLIPGRQIWIYFTHMADANGYSYISPAFPPGTEEKFVEARTLLGYQGNYSGDAYNPVGIHLHFSMVKDDGQGNFLNELKIENTIDPSPYLGLPLNGKMNRSEIPICPQNSDQS
jgi:peptidoglycan LD-endopeptidase LytH